MIKILVADDHDVVRKGIIQILSKDSDMVVTDEAANGNEVIEKVQKSNFDIIILDIAMPLLSGIDVLKYLKKQKDTPPVLVLSMYSEKHYAIRCLRAGASGYLTKRFVAEELTMAVRGVLKEGKYISPSVALQLADNLVNHSNKQLHELLTDREYQVLCMLAMGKSVTDIANELLLSVKTISNFRGNLIKKMKMKNNADLIRYAIKNNLVD